jgi:hypothetical protein
MDKAEGEMVLDEKGLEAAIKIAKDPAANEILSDHSKKAIDCVIEKAIQAYLSATRAATESDGWMAIESAPKDGTIIDLWDCGARLTDCFWNVKESRWERKYYCVWVPNPTHYMPLPSPPGTHPAKTGDDILEKGKSS